ncbi:CDP-Glycerol:Poly(glycerophosphate) glycerophosphotransferase [Ruminococcaceae bacterium KH2T8]|nr:CDP-Glycerol:Poly(glycerophosphate) glycerophosphotransferase [Ruminococcaceae bacterium KH2T8]
MHNFLLYIDPGTGSMLFTILIGILGVIVYFARSVFMKIKFLVTGGKKTKDSGEKKNFVIYSDHKRYWSIFKPICDEFEARGVKVDYLTASPDDPVLTHGYKHITPEFIGEGNKGFSKLNLLKADIVLSTTPSLDVFQWKRSKDVKFYVHTFHSPGNASMYRMFGLDYYDAVLLSGEHQEEQIKILEANRDIKKKELVYAGLPYMDVLTQRLKEAAKPSEEKDKKTVLIAPSWGSNGILTKYGSRMIDALVKTGYEIVIRPHPQSFTAEKEMIDELMAKYPDIEWNRDNDNFDVLMRSDILISDFSGVIFEYALIFDKPVMYAANSDFDLSAYDAYWIDKWTGKKPWTFTILPRIGMEITEESLDDMKETIDRCITSSEYREGRDSAREAGWKCRGTAAKDTVDYLIDRHLKLNK